MSRCDQREGKPWGIGEVARRAAGACAAVVMATLACVGCGGSGFASYTTYAVEGRVLLANGRPLTSGQVVFVRKDGLTPPASGSIGRDGRFALTTKAADDGAVPGDYKIRIEPAAPLSRRRGGVPPLGFPIKYIDEDSSGLTVTVRADENQLDPIRLK